MWHHVLNLWLTPSVFVILLVGLVLWLGQRIPLSGRRKWAAIGCRLIVIGALCAGLWGAPRRHTHEIPRAVIYLVDHSASIDAGQQEWMARRVASLESIRPASLERGMVVFGSDARVIMPLGRDPLRDPQMIRQAIDASGVSRERTNFEAGVLTALGLFPPGHRGSILLFSDGRETSGNLTEILSYVRRLGFDLFPVPTPVVGVVKTVWESLAVPPVVRRGSPVPIELVVFNGTPRPKQGYVAIALQGVPIKRQRVTVRPGWQVMTVTVPAIGRGTMSLDVDWSIPEERVSEHRRAYTEVEGPPQVLLVSEHVGTLPLLATALKHREMDIAIGRPADIPTDVKPLLDYDALLLFNLPKSALSDHQVDAMASYVKEFGGGVVMVGLGGDLAHEINTPAPLDALLPVTFEPKGLQEAKRRVCMILLIDRSASMLGPRMAATKRAAVELVKQLAPEDLVGVFAFDTLPYVVAEVQPASQVRGWLVEKLVKLHSTGGTDVYPALVASSNRLELSGATVKHIILLSDGYTPFHESAYKALTAAFHENGTTVSTIGIGASFINTDYMEWLAQSTGGTFYQLQNLDDLPRLIARDTQQALERLPFTEGSFRPTKTPTTDWFAETSEWPVLRGYFTTTARASARVDLTINGGDGDLPAAQNAKVSSAAQAGDPLLARWTVGRGRVVSFTSDADARWSPEWIRWPGFEGAWGQIVRWAMRPRLTEELFVWVDESRGSPQLVLEGELHDPRAELIAAEGPATIPLSLIQTGEWRWHAALEQIPSGWYQLALESHEGTTPIFAKRWVQIGTPPTAQELTGQPPREPFLREVARSSSGVYDVPDRAFVPPTTTATTTAPVLTWWLPLVILALLVDIALRGSSML